MNFVTYGSGGHPLQNLGSYLLWITLPWSTGHAGKFRRARRGRARAGVFCRRASEIASSRSWRSAECGLRPSRHSIPICNRALSLSSGRRLRRLARASLEWVRAWIQLSLRPLGRRPRARRRTLRLERRRASTTMRSTTASSFARHGSSSADLPETPNVRSGHAALFRRASLSNTQPFRHDVFSVTAPTYPFTVPTATTCRCCASIAHGTCFTRTIRGPGRSNWSTRRYPPIRRKRRR